MREAVAGLTEPKVKALASDSLVSKVKRSITGSGYATESLEAALWCFARTTTFEAAILEAANLGDDADTTAAIAGQLAGAYYGRKRDAKRESARRRRHDDVVTLVKSLECAQ